MTPRGFCQSADFEIMIILPILLLSVLGAPYPLFKDLEPLGETQPALVKAIQKLPLSKAYELAKISNYFPTRGFSHDSKLDIVAKVDKSVKLALRYHNAEEHGLDAIQQILEIPKTHRYKYLIHLLKNPTIDLSIGSHKLARKLVADGDIQSIGLLVNNHKIDLSYDDNYLIALASSYQNVNMISLLLKDQRIRQSFVYDDSSDSDADLESLNFEKRIRPESDSEIAVNGRYIDLGKSLDGEPLMNSFSGLNLDVDGMSDLESISLSTGLRNMENDEDYDWIDKDVDWEYLNSDDDLSREMKKLIKSLI